MQHRIFCLNHLGPLLNFVYNLGLALGIVFWVVQVSSVGVCHMNGYLFHWVVEVSMWDLRAALSVEAPLYLLILSKDHIKFSDI